MRWRFEGKRVFVYCTKTYKLVGLYRIVQGGRNGEETVCGADCGWGGVEDAAEFAGGGGGGPGERGDLRAVLGERLEKASRAQSRGRLIRLPYAITAGDEFQAIAWSCGRLAELIFDLRATMWPPRLPCG